MSGRAAAGRGLIDAFGGTPLPAEPTAFLLSASMLRVQRLTGDSMRGNSSMFRIGTANGTTTQVISVLLIEDDEADSLLTRELLHDTGLQVSLTWAQSIGAAVPELAKAPSCVLLDLGLPDSEGFDGLRRVLELAPDAAVLVLTGANDESLGVGAVTAGAQDYLVKGQVDGTMLGRCIRYAIERKRADESARQLHEAAIRQAEYARLERGLLPVPILNDPSLYHALSYRPGRDQALLGGDFYDLIELSDGTLHALIGDVAGHGPDEAALGVCLRVAWRTLVLSGREPHQTLACLQEVLERERHRKEVFATVAMVSLDASTGTGSLRLAGHPPPVVLGKDPRLLTDERPGPPLGLFDVDWPGIAFSLGPNWSLMLYTDGLIEGRGGPGSEIVGCDGLVELIIEAGSAGDLPGFPESLPDTLVKQVERLNGQALADDIAVLVVGRRQ
ncbi:MAG TPA: SpoIIE family protein phosphatase [Streptosporangiaceae bacterium]|nr:SpoIIE family protein phosphatase [Streptosporangiaceae bacterium]